MSKANELMEREERSKRCRNEESWNMDGMMSMLPDELLVIILSNLTLKEAAATSILSRRWRYLWTFTDKLVFDGTTSLLKLKPIYGKTFTAILGEKRSDYVKWVNHVIASRNDSVPIHDFKVLFNLKKSHEEQIHEWIRYALERKVQTLELKLSNKGYRILNEQFCSIPYRFLNETCSSIHFKQLRRISLEYVDVSGEALEFLLCSCPLLEGLSVCHSGELVTLRVIGPFPSLKLLEIRSCYWLESVEIRDVNLVTLKYSGSDPWRYVKFVVENVPMLVELSLGTGIIFLDCFILQFWRILDQLEMLNIEMHGHFDMLDINMQCGVPSGCDYPLTSLPAIIRAAPRLERLELKAYWWRLCWVRRIEEKEKKNLYEKSKEIRVVGYGGTIYELELAKHLVEKAAALQKITIHTNLINDNGSEARAWEWAWAHAHQLLGDQLPYPIIIEIH